jgi:hypothetical protein
MKNMTYVHEIKLEEETPFAKAFNVCSELWQRSQDENLSEQERKEAGEEWLTRRQQLEMGMI